jgi:spore germination protein
MIIYTVQQGDTINSVAERFNIPRARLEQDNNLSPNAPLITGQSLMIANPSQTYTVQSGDTLAGLADTFGTTVMHLLRNNPQLSDRNPITLNEGEELVIQYDTGDKKIEVYGYTNVFISESVLIKTLPYLTYLTILNYRITAEGELIDIDDVDIIRTAKEYGVAPVMFISSITEQGVGSYDVTHSILNSQELQDRLIENVLSVMKQKGYYGLEVAFVHVLPEDLPLYANFIAEITNRLNTEGYKVFVSLLPSTFGFVPGSRYEYSYYSDIGQAADYVLLISFLWSSAFITDVAKTAADYMKEYVDFAVTQIPPDKIFVGITRMGYDFLLPYVEGQTPGRLITNFSAVNLANQLGVEIQFDETTQTPYYYYTESGIEHYVWFKDARTVNAIVNLVSEYGLRGVSVWNIMYYYSPTWFVINTQYEVVKVLPESLT